MNMLAIGAIAGTVRICFGIFGLDRNFYVAPVETGISYRGIKTSCLVFLFLLGIKASFVMFNPQS
jgi:hypothetical protein